MSKTLIAFAAAAGLLAGMTAVSAQTPGHEMQLKGSVKGSPGASGYAPGHQMQTKGSVKGSPGASGYAPGHTTTGAAVNGEAGVKAGGTHLNTGVKANVK